ncbi:MAG: hypothetical protein WC471_02825 [Candidatus Woesearchaeota archaeon]|jgi:hypothetical protein
MNKASQRLLRKTVVKSKKKTLKAQAAENPERDEDLKEYLNRKDFHPFELELLMNDYDDGLDDNDASVTEE